LTRRHRGGRLRRLAWFAGLWAAGVVAVAAFAYLLRLALAP
jgi:Protein of unknown function (DUF2474)